MKIAIGCLIQWYEIEIVEEYLSSLRKAIDAYDGEVLVNILVSLGEDFEKLNREAVPPVKNYAYDPPEYMSGRTAITTKIYQTGLRYDFGSKIIKFDEGTWTIADYRRSFNNKYCRQADVIVWGETDMLVPKNMFNIIADLHKSAEERKIYKYVATFASCKMWDKSWKPLEHPEFTDKPFIEGDTKNWWSLRYTMSYEEMEHFNEKVEQPNVHVISPKKFNGCGLVISSEVIKAGVNIPPAIYFVHEDTSFLYMLNRLLPDAPQFHINNILLVHNRKHPKKRMYVQGEENIDKTNTGALRAVHDWYKPMNKGCEENANNLFNINYKFNER